MSTAMELKGNGRFPGVKMEYESGRTQVRGRILVVDDENGPRQALRMVLNEDYDVVLAEDVPAAQKVLEEQPVDLIITDIRMPRMTGVDLLKWAKGAFPETEVIILTGYSDLRTAMKAVEYGAFAYLEKPYDTNVLLKYVEDSLAKRRRELERRKMEHLALEANRFETLGRFVSGMLHDLGTPLAVIGSQAELVKAKPGREDFDQRLEAIRAQSHLCSEIVRTAMNFLRHQRQQKVMLNLNDVAEACVDVGQPVIAKSEVKVRRDYAENIPMFAGDFVLVRQAVLNLITNACHAMENCLGPRELTLSTWEDEGRLFLSIGDSGPGIPQELRDRAFETFFTTKGEEGTGLGLVAVKNIMHRHDGEVSLGESEQGGALFTLQFPVKPEPTE